MRRPNSEYAASPEPIVKTFSKILVPVDFSEHSERALRVAADLARRYEAKLTVAHVYEPVTYAAPESFLLYAAQQTPGMLAEYDKLLAKSSQDARGEGAQQVDTKLLQGTAFVEITRFAKEGGYDLIVMGTHGRTGIAHVLMGSVAERVVRKATCPVMAVRAVGESK
jgi:nucleotide-binding universal stress UspA family protein